ncbi:MAG TPA: M23 family metallopeptidase [Kofleriaceae bacterium]|nr:M23 family metallopeptidase [Kofleriaceae bacterium]
MRPSILPDPIDARRPNVGYETTKPLPRFVPVFAPHDGVILYAGKITITCEDKTFNRYQLWIDHGGGWATRYANLEHVFATPTDRFDRGRKARVRAGDVIGYANPSPLELGFELWRCDDETFGPIEPHDYMHTWIALPWSEHPDNQVAA